MFDTIIQKVRRLLYKMGVIQGLKDVTQHKEISITDEMYKEIEKWKKLYKGHLPEWHDLTYQTVDGQKSRKMDTLLMPKVVSQEMASLIFNEKCEISIGDETLSDNIHDVFKQNKFNKKFQDYLEYGLALGGFVVKPYVKDDQIKLSFVTADSFIPIAWHNDNITEGLFVDEFRRGKKKYTLLEWHLWENGSYVVRNDLYESETDDMGVKVPLDTYFPELEEEVVIKGLKRSLFTYFKPNIANNVDLQSPLGISVYANALDTMRVLDGMFDSFNREFRLGKKKVIVPAHMIKTIVDHQSGEMKRYFDATDETFEAMNYSTDNDDIKDITVELRVDEHISAINATLNLLAIQTGFSAGAFSFDGQSMKTATEVVSEQSKTFKTKQSHETIIEAGLQDLIQSIVDIAKLYNVFNAPNEFEVTVTFDDSIAEDKTAEITRLAQELSQKIIPKKRAIMQYYGLTDDEAQLWLDEINEENQQVREQDVAMFGGDG